MQVAVNKQLLRERDAERFMSRNSLIASLVIVLYFFLLTHHGLATYFTDDDLMNISYLHGYGQVSIPLLLTEALTVFTPEYRPVTGLYYRTLYALFGLRPFPFRVVFFVFLALNLLLAARYFRRLTGSPFIATTGTLLLAFNPATPEVYYNNGAVYDVLCLFFVLFALSVYTRIRQENRFLTLGELLAVAALYGAALGSKEMALVLPGVLVLYEAIFYPNWRDLRRRTAPILGVALMTLLCLFLKLVVPNPMSTNIAGAYTPQFLPSFIAQNYLHYYQLLFFRPGLPGVALAAGLAVALIAALALRDRLMLFGLLFANLTLFPACVISPRTGTPWYIPLVGYALFGGSAIARFTHWLASWVQPRIRPEWTRAAAFAVLAILLYSQYARKAEGLRNDFRPLQQQLRTLLSAARGAAPVLPKGSRILVESDPFQEVTWQPLFLMRLGYGDPTLWVDRPLNSPEQYNPGDVSLYAMRMHWNGSSYHVEVQPPPQGPPVAFQASPNIVRRGHLLQVRFPATLAGCPVDAAYRMSDDELIRSGVWLSWTMLDGHGAGQVALDQDAERGRVVHPRLPSRLVERRRILSDHPLRDLVQPDRWVAVKPSQSFHYRLALAAASKGAGRVLSPRVTNAPTTLL